MSPYLKLLIGAGPFNERYIMKTVIMSIAEFINFELIAFKQAWDYKVKKGHVEVTAHQSLFNSLGYEC